MRHPFRRKNLSPRLFPFYAAVVLAVALARPAPLGFALGGALVLAGAALRLWGGGHLVKNHRLTFTGPYAHMRHPLYAGTLLLGTGFGAMAGVWGWLFVAAFFLPVFFVYYLPYKDRVEGARLERRYGVAYDRYRRAVPALLPTLAPWTPPSELAGDGRGWSGERLRANGELGTLVGVCLGLMLLSLRLALAP